MTRRLPKQRDCRWAWALLATALVACSGGPADIQVAETCASSRGFIVETQIGANTSCADALRNVEWFQDVLAEQWGRADLTGWTVRVLTGSPVEGHQGSTWQAEKTLDIQQDSLIVLPHEMHHVQAGPGHDGWCPFGSWEKQRLGLDEADYLGCQ